MTKVSITREQDDLIAEARISLGKPHNFDGFYIVFRGEPEKVIELLRQAAVAAERLLPLGEYSDRR